MTEQDHSHRVTGAELVPADGDGPRDASAAVRPMLHAVSAGRPALVIDGNLDRGYFVGAAEHASTEFVVTASTYGRGVLKVVMEGARLAELEMEPLGARSPGLFAPVDLRGSDRPGSHVDRVATLRALANPKTVAEDLVVPGHVFPVATDVDDNGDRPGVAQVIAAGFRLAGREPVAAYGDAADEGGLPADGAATRRLATRLGLALATVDEIQRYVDRNRSCVTRVVETAIPTPSGRLTAIGFVGNRSSLEYVAFVAPPLAGKVRVHVHRRCQVSDVFGGLACGCGERLRDALATIQKAGNGVVLYHGDRLEASCAPGRHTQTASRLESVEIGSVLRDLGAEHIFLSMNEPLRSLELESLGLRIERPRRDDGLRPASPLHAAK